MAFQESSPITLLHKLRQLSDGFIYREEGTFSQPNSPKELKLKELLEFYLDQEIPRVVIYGGFKESLNKIKEVCRGSGFTVGLSSGGHPVSSDFLSDFASSSSKPLACVANPGCTFGLNLSRSPVLIYYSNTFRPDDRTQSQERADRYGKDMSYGTRVIDIINLPTDLQVLQKIKENIRIEELTLEEIQKCLLN